MLASADIPLGVPFNIASYAALTQVMAQMSGMLVGDFIHTFGDYHVYTNQVELMTMQLEREPRRLPSLFVSIGTQPSVEEYMADPFANAENFDFDVVGYDPHPAIKFPAPAV